MQICGIDKDRMIFTSCNICGSNNYYQLYEIEISPVFVPSRLVRCQECGLFYANPRLERELEEDYYRRRYHEDQGEGYWYTGRIDVFKRSLRRINGFLKVGRLVDVGCGMGYFMDLARSDGWEAAGVEISDYAVSHAKEKLGLNVIKGKLSDAQFETGYFDVATMWNVLDQIYDPKATLVELNRILKIGGYLFIRISNLHFHIKLLKAYNALRHFMWKVKEPLVVFHLYSFDKNSIKRLLNITGFFKITVELEPIGTNVPAFAKIFGKNNGRTARRLFDIGARIAYILSLRQVIISPSIFVIARKEK